MIYNRQPNCMSQRNVAGRLVHCIVAPWLQVFAHAFWHHRQGVRHSPYIDMRICAEDSLATRLERASTDRVTSFAAGSKTISGSPETHCTISAHKPCAHGSTYDCRSHSCIPLFQHLHNNLIHTVLSPYYRIGKKHVESRGQTRWVLFYTTVNSNPSKLRC